MAKTGPASRVVPTACSGGRLVQARGEACQRSSCNTAGKLMADADDRLQKARSRWLMHSKNWGGGATSDGIDDGRTAAKLQRDVDLARDDVRCLEAKLESRFGGI